MTWIHTNPEAADLKILAVIVALLLLAGLAGGYYYYRQLDASLVRLTPEVQKELRAQTAAQDESADRNLREPRTAQPFNADRNVYFGDLHVHTSLSFDSYLFGNRNNLDDAYHFANGEDLALESGERLRISRPLDFVAMTDHAESFALWPICEAAGLSGSQREFCEQFEQPSVFFFKKLRDEGVKRPIRRSAALCPTPEDCIPAENTTWARIRAAADRYNQPGEFTAFVSYEYSPVLKETGKIHRNVIFRSNEVPDHAVSAYDAPTVLDLWRRLTSECQGTCEVLTIPHNMNKMWGLAYSGETIDGDVYSSDDWALRGLVEPLAEIFQIKGASECAVGAGAVDEECNFEQIMPICTEGQSVGCGSVNSFAREGLKKGLVLQKELGFNPLRFGFIAATDTHNGNPGDTEEWDSRGPNGLFASPAAKRMTFPKADFKSGISRSAGGLAAIWAEENTRASLFDAMKRRETFGTSGTRIQLRFFGGEELSGDLAGSADAIREAYQVAMPMGGVLPDTTSRARFFVWAQRDPFSAPLQKLQVIKGWVDEEGTHERVFDIACSDGLVPDASGQCPDNGARVDVTNCGYSEDVGDAQLAVVWEDPDFQPGLAAFYYVRALENPTCRWSTYDAIRLGMAPRDDVPPVLQERAWSSPIWYRVND